MLSKYRTSGKGDEIVELNTLNIDMKLFYLIFANCNYDIDQIMVFGYKGDRLEENILSEIKEISV